MTKPTYEELLQACIEYREACCAGMRVLAGEDVARHLLGTDDQFERFAFEVRAAGVADGFGKRNDEVIRLARETPR